MFYAIADIKTDQGVKSLVFGDLGNQRHVAERKANAQAKELGATVTGVYLTVNNRKINQRVEKPHWLEDKKKKVK